MARKPAAELVLYREQGKCGALLTNGSGKRCKNAAGQGTDHPGFGSCKHHLGATAVGVRSAEQERARSAVEQFGIPVETTPQDALLQEVHRSAGVVAYLDGVVQELQQDKLKQYTQDDDGKRWERESVWVKMYRDERAHMVKVCAEAIKCGVAERQVKLAEQQGLALAGAIRLILSELGVADHPNAPDVVRRHLIAIAS